MLKTLFEIKDNIKRVGERIFTANSWEFQRGFNVCYNFFEQELNKTVLYHQTLLFERIHELETVLAEQGKKAENLAKVSSFGVMAIEEAHTKENLQFTSTIEKHKKEISEQNIKINQLEGRVKHLEAKKLNLENQLKSRKTNKKYRKLLEFIKYNNLESDLAEFHGQAVEPLNSQNT